MNKKISSIISIVLIINLIIMNSCVYAMPIDNVDLNLGNKVDLNLILQNADYIDNYSNYYDDINSQLKTLHTNIRDLNFIEKRIATYSYTSFLDSGSDLNLVEMGSRYSISQFDNTDLEFDNTDLTIIDINNNNVENIEHICNFFDTYNDKYCWKYCNICGESAEYLKEKYGNDISSPTDNGNNTKGNINIKEHVYDIGNTVVHRQVCGDCMVNGYCSCGKYGIRGTTYSLNMLKNSSCRGCARGACYVAYYYPYTFNHTRGTIGNCSYCGNLAAGSTTCLNATEHETYAMTFSKDILNKEISCSCGSIKSKLLNYFTEWVDDTHLHIHWVSEFNNINCNFNNISSDVGNNAPYYGYLYPTTSSPVTSTLLSAGGGKYVYEYDTIITFPEHGDTLKYNDSYLIETYISSPNLSLTFDLGGPQTISSAPTIDSISSTPTASKSDTDGNEWIENISLEIKGTELTRYVSVKIMDDAGHIYYLGNGIKDGNNWSTTFTPEIEAGQIKEFIAIAADGTGKESAPYRFEIDLTDSKPPKIISELDFSKDWKKEIIFRAETLEGGVGKTRIAINNQADFGLCKRLTNPDNSGNDIYYRYYALYGDLYGDDETQEIILYAKDDLGHLDKKKVIIGKIDSTKPIIEDIIIKDNNIEIIANDNHPTKGVGSGIASYSIIPHGKSVTLESFKFTEPNISFISSGKYDIYVTDVAGNISEPKTIEIRGKNDFQLDNIKGLTLINIIHNDDKDIRLKDNNLIIDNIKNNYYYMIWHTKDNMNIITNFLNQMDGTNTFYKKRDME